MKYIIIFMIEFYTIWILGCLTTDWLIDKIKKQRRRYETRRLCQNNVLEKERRL